MVLKIPRPASNPPEVPANPVAALSHPRSAMGSSLLNPLSSIPRCMDSLCDLYGLWKNLCPISCKRICHTGVGTCRLMPVGFKLRINSVSHLLRPGRTGLQIPDYHCPWFPFPFRYFHLFSPPNGMTRFVLQLVYLLNFTLI